MLRMPQWLLVLACVLTITLPGRASAQEQQPAQLWADFNHYVLIARPDLAAAAGQTLLQTVDNAQLLQIVEASDYAQNYQRTLQRGQKIDQVRETALELEQRIQDARISESRQPDRIVADIALLPEGQRPYRNAVQRLRAAGQYAAPQLLAALLDQGNPSLQPYVMAAMIDVGRPLSYPLAVALPQLPPVAQAQVARVLAEIGYPLPLPYIKAVLEEQELSPEVRATLEQAYDRLAQIARISGDASAAQLFLSLGRDQYRLATQDPTNFIGYDASEGSGLVWTYGPRIGLIPVPVPGPIYGDVLAMQSTRDALQRNASLDEALSYYLAANLRRENRLPEGANDPSYPREAEQASYYAMLAGPARVQDVLQMALDARDPALALDAIAVLAETAGTAALISEGQASQPLLKALSYPDRRVRFRAAEALANARPESAFDGSFRVVPILANSVRQTGSQYAMVIAQDQEQLNQLLAAMRDLGYTAFGGLSLDEVSSQLEQTPGVDLIVASLQPQQVAELYNASAGNYRLGGTSILALVPSEVMERMSEWTRDKARVQVAARSTNPEDLRSAVDAIAAAGTGESVQPEEAEQMSITALQLLREIAVFSPVYRVGDALPALAGALDDERDQIVTLSSRVLALINDQQAQQALATAAFDNAGDLQITLLGSLAESARYFGNMLTSEQVSQLEQLVETSTGDTALAAAEAHGALSLPTAKAVNVILK